MNRQQAHSPDQAGATSRQRGRSWWVPSLALVGALLVGQWLDRSTDDTDAMVAPFTRAGEAGEQVALRYADVEAGRVGFAAQIGWAGRVSATNGVFVIVPVRVVARDEPVVLGGVELRAADGRRYAPDSRAGRTASAAPTGIDWHLYLTFEVPEDAVPGLRLVLTKGDLVDGSARRDDLAEIDLGLDEDDRAAAAHAVRDTRIEIPEPGLEPAELTAQELLRPRTEDEQTGDEQTEDEQTGDAQTGDEGAAG